MNLHGLITLMNLLIGTSGINEIKYIEYTSEYILKLQIHQHSLLTRKVFSRHNSSKHKSSSLDYHWNIIIITASIILINWCYLSILLIKGSSTEPALFHVGLQLLHNLYLTMGGTHPTSMLERPTQHLHLTM